VSEQPAAENHVMTALPVGRGAIGTARRFVAAALASWRVEGSVGEDAALVVSELVTNAVLHASPPLALDLHRTADGVRISVDDASARLPEPAGPPPADAESGRGLGLVAALGLSWGVEPRPPGKRVWCLLHG
jgi:anti-sigma regulatory factor (Ser/Thr protein kinase)